MTNHNQEKDKANNIPNMSTSNWGAINPEYVARMRMQNKFQTGIDIARYTAGCLLYTSDAADE